MAEKKTVEVMIEGKLYSLCGYEEETYLQRIAAYINGKVQDMRSQSGFSKQSNDMQKVLIQLNIADDYFKAKTKIDELEKKISEQEKELYSLKHELVSMKMRIEDRKQN